MKLSDILLLIKGGKRAAVGEIRNWKGGSYIKTPTGWKPHEKQYSKKYTERKNNAATKKDTDLRKRQSEVARLSGEIQGHKAAVEHHTSQNTKQDTRQAKHHAIRAQVKQRRLDKHKEILEQRHGVSINTSHPLSLDGFTDSYVNSSRYADKIKSKPEMLELEKDAAKQKWVDTLKEKSLTERLPNQAIDDYVSEFGVNALHSVFRGVHEKGIEGWLPKDMRESRDNSYEEKMEEVNKLQNKAKIQEEKQTRKNIKESKSDMKANFEKWKADRQGEKPKEKPIKEKKLSQRNSFLKDRYEAGHSLSDIFKELKKDYLRDPTTANAIFTDFIKSQKESGNQKLMNEFNGTSFIENIHDTPQYKEMLTRHGIDPSDPYKEKEQPKPKENIIQSGSRGATIAGQQYSKREVDILNSLDEIIGRAKSPVVQDLLKKRQAAKPTPKTSNLEPHESKFMELVGKNRSQADKQAGYPTERRKVEAETGVKIPREKAVEMTKHMKASFIWDIKKPSLIR